MLSQILSLCYKQVKGQLNENLTADQMSLGAFFFFFFFLAYTPSNQELLCRDVANKAIITMMMMSKVQGSFSFLSFFFFGS